MSRRANSRASKGYSKSQTNALGRRQQPEFRRVRLAGDDKARVDGFLRHGIIDRGRRVGAETRAPCGGLAGDIVQVLDEIGHAREWARRKGAFGAGAGVFEHLPYNGIEFRIGRLDALDRRVDEFKRRHLLRTDKLRMADAVVTRKGVMRSSALRPQARAGERRGRAQELAAIDKSL